MTDLNYDLHYLSAGLEELEAYLLSKELFWHVTTPPNLRPFPMLTIANLLLANANLKAYNNENQLSPPEKTTYARLERELDAIHHKWAVAWQQKAAHEYESRLRQWLNYLNELKEDLENNAPYYHTEVRNRVLLELLKESAPKAVEPDISDIDAVVRAKLTPGEFIWDAALQSAFPQEQYWFLYGTPKTQSSN